MSAWTAPAFSSLPILDGTDCRWVGTTVMDEEQYRLERWQRRQVADAIYWQASIPGMIEYGQLRQLRRDDRKAAWQTRQAADDDWSRHVAAMVEAGP